MSETQKSHTELSGADISKNRKRGRSQTEGAWQAAVAKGSGGTPCQEKIKQPSMGHFKEIATARSQGPSVNCIFRKLWANLDHTLKPGLQSTSSLRGRNWVRTSGRSVVGTRACRGIQTEIPSAYPQAHRRTSQGWGNNHKHTHEPRTSIHDSTLHRTTLRWGWQSQLCS